MPEVAHYFRFNEIYHRRHYAPDDRPHSNPSGTPFDVDYDAVYPILKNPHSEHCATCSELQRLNEAFNRAYTLLLLQIEQGFSGNPKLVYTAIRNGMASLPSIAREMARIPVPDTETPTTGAPSYEWAPPPS